MTCRAMRMPVYEGVNVVSCLSHGRLYRLRGDIHDVLRFVLIGVATAATGPRRDCLTRSERQRQIGRLHAAIAYDAPKALILVIVEAVFVTVRQQDGAGGRFDACWSCQQPGAQVACEARPDQKIAVTVTDP